MSFILFIKRKYHNRKLHQLAEYSHLPSYIRSYDMAITYCFVKKKIIYFTCFYLCHLFYFLVFLLYNFSTKRDQNSLKMATAIDPSELLGNTQEGSLNIFNFFNLMLLI